MKSNRARRWRAGLALSAVCGAAVAAPAAELGGATWGAPSPALALICGALGASTAAAVTYAARLSRRLAASQVQARRLATHDTLLGLPNRIHFRFALDDAFSGRATQVKHGLLYVDLDRFKDVNDSYGHEIGDRLLVAFGRRVSGLLGANDVFARVGGDEFAILRSGVKDEDDLMRFCREIVAAMEAPFDLGSHCLSVTVSIGAALGPEGVSSRTEWAQRADFALYQAKTFGRGRACLFETNMLETFRRRRVVKRDLVAAIAAGEIEAHYQPIFESDGQRIVSAEALLRWRHREFGSIPADLVVSVAEESGQIIPLGDFMLRRACADAKGWNGPRVSVNVSAIQFRSRGFVETVKRVLDETGLPPERLELELTETAVVSEPDLAEESMLRLRAMGVRMVLDDFGAGYSSLMYLRRFPFDKIKIDRSFVETVEAEGESAVLLSMLVKLGHALGLRCVAEGIETVEQLWIARNFGCEEVQGYLLARPASLDEFNARLAAMPNALREPAGRRAGGLTRAGGRPAA